MRDALVEEERIICLRPIDEPLHPPDDIVPSGQGARVLLVVREHDNVVGLIAESFCKSAT